MNIEKTISRARKQTNKISKPKPREKGQPFEKMYKQMNFFYQLNGHCLVPFCSNTDPMKKLYTWVVRMRQLRKTGSRALTPERIARLNKINFIWDVRLEHLFGRVRRDQELSIESLKQIRKAIGHYVQWLEEESK
jgi:hypothetical protein